MHSQARCSRTVLVRSSLSSKWGAFVQVIIQCHRIYLKQMRDSFQVSLHKQKWFRSEVRRTLSKNLAMEVPILVREEDQLDDILKACGFDERRRNEFYHTTSKVMDGLRGTNPNDKR